METGDFYFSYSGKEEFSHGDNELVSEQMTDMLTGLWNEAKFGKDMKKYLKKTEGCFILLGIDDFKNINVQKGRSFGNFVLQTISEVLREMAEEPVRIYRMDGDRFGVFFPKENREEAVQEIYKVLSEQLEKYCTVSAGAVFCAPADKLDGEFLYQYAENALDQAKQRGKNMLVFFSQEDYQKGLEQMKLREELKCAVQNDFCGFSLRFQPQVNVSDFGIYGVETLLRYRSADGKQVSPNEFIPVLEQTGMICPVGMWVFQKAIRQCKEWRKRIPGFHMNINISYLQLRQQGIAEQVLEFLEKEGLEGDALTFEVTESIQLQDYAYYNKIFRKWKNHGIEVAIDDFGTGYSSLGYLKSLEINEVKIDRCFISHIQCNAYNYRLLRNIIELAHSVGIQVCCEGVETEEELMTILELKPDILQGFFFAKPSTREEIEKMYFREEMVEYRRKFQNQKKLSQLEEEETKNFLQQVQREELGGIVENFEDMIFVSDPDTYEMYYMNEVGRKITGVYDYRGRKCYEVVQGRTSPCEFCTNYKLVKNQFYVWGKENTHLKGYSILRERLIPWKGKMARLELAINISREKNELFGYRNSEILENTNLGLWMIYMNPETGQCAMFGDKVMTRLLGAKGGLTPEEYYLHWYNRINDGYYQYVNMAMESIVQTGKIIQVEYTWDHPSRGDVMVRCMGVRVKDQNGMICVEGYHRVISDLERPDFLPDSLKSEIFEYNEKRHAIYFHTKRIRLAGEGQKEENFPECWIEEGIVHPHYEGKFRSMFENVQDKKESSSTEILLQNKQKIYKWFKVKTRLISEKEKDRHTLLVLVEPAEQERTMELEYARKSDFYEAMLSETVAYAEVDLESKRFMMTGGLWESYEQQCRKENIDFEEYFHRHAQGVIHPDDVKAYGESMGLSNLKKLYQEGITTRKYSLRRIIDGNMCWMELSVHIFLDRVTGNMYALFYLKNIDAEKKRDMAQEQAAQRDPLTNVYNRATFERKVISYMKQNDSRGMLLMMDIDDFKMINDKYGHLQGDEALKNLTRVLQNTFRSHDLIGRLGGDEFLVFVKGIISREVLNHRLEHMVSLLNENSEGKITCSVGISMAEGENFVYEDVLNQADIALYQSKKRGKNQYSYYEETEAF